MNNYDFTLIFFKTPVNMPSQDNYLKDFIMKTKQLFILLNLLLVCLSLTGCRRQPRDGWEDSKTAGRHVNRGVRNLGGKHGDSRQVRSRGEFYDESGYVQNASADFIPLGDVVNSNEGVMADSLTPQPRENPGDPGSSVPGIDAFRDPSTVPGMARIFKNVQFEYNSNLVKGQSNLETIRQIADYMKKNPRVYIFVEGHCDDRGPQAYNLALGARRSNAVRNLLISEGVNPDNIFTISYGKERPLLMEQHEEAWQQNRRAEFKIYQR